MFGPSPEAQQPKDIIPQGPGSNLNSDQVDGINATTKPNPNCLLPLDSNGKFPVSVITTSGGGGSGFLLGNGMPTDKNILIADGTLWQSRTMGGDATISIDTGTLTLASTGISAGTYGDANHVPQLTFDVKGRATAETSVLIEINANEIIAASSGTLSFISYTSSSISPQAIAYDGTNMWTADGSGGVSKITPSGTFTTFNAGSVFANASGIAFDGTNMWATDNTNAIIVKVSPTGTLTSFTTGTNGGTGVAFDGSNMWVAGTTGVSKVTSAGSATLFSYAHPVRTLAFDGVNMWGVVLSTNSIIKIDPSGSITTYALLVGIQPHGIAFDGVNMWTSNIGDNSVSKVDPSGVETNYSGTGHLNVPRGIDFDGTNMWACSYGDNTVSIVTPTGAMTTFGFTGSNPYAIAKKSSTEMWTADVSAPGVTKVTRGSFTLGIVNNQIDTNAAIDVTKFQFPLLGDTLYGGTAGASTVLSGNISSTKKLYSQTGTGSLSAAPSWSVLVSGDIPNNAANTSGTALNITASSNTSLTSLVNLATIGTIGTGIWHGTKIGLLYGGTNADLSGTGGTHQVLQQSTSGAAITVGQLAFSDISSTIATGQVSGSYTGITAVGTLTSLTMGGSIQLFGDTTGVGTTIGFGTNSPAVTLTAPYTWLKFISSDSSVVWVPAFK